MDRKPSDAGKGVIISRKRAKSKGLKFEMKSRWKFCGTGSL